MKLNPFRPNQLVGPGMFAGRVDELIQLDKALHQTRNGNPFHILIHGERGIGKSSLLFVFEHTAKGNMKGIESGSTYAFITATIAVEPSTDFRQLVRKIGSEVAREVRKLEYVRSAAKNAWEFLTCLEGGGFKFNRPEEQLDPSEASEQLCDTIQGITTRLAGKIDGIAIMIDEADNSCPEAQLGEFIKIFTERLTRLNCNNVLLAVSGISNVIEKIRTSHPSSPRILNHIHLEPLLDGERKEVIRRGLDEANKVNDENVSATPGAEEWIARFSEGYPHFIQQYASSAFDTDNNNSIDVDDVMQGAFTQNGALDQLGVRYFREMYSEQINSDEYRKVLQVMAVHPDKYVSRQDIATQTGLKPTTLGNALRALKDRKIILAHAEKPGLYKLPTDSFALWIRMRAQQQSAGEAGAQKTF